MTSTLYHFSVFCQRRPSTACQMWTLQKTTTTNAFWDARKASGTWHQPYTTSPRSIKEGKALHVKCGPCRRPPPRMHSEMHEKLPVLDINPVPLLHVLSKKAKHCMSNVNLAEDHHHECILRCKKSYRYMSATLYHFSAFYQRRQSTACQTWTLQKTTTTNAFWDAQKTTGTWHQPCTSSPRSVKEG